MVALLQNAAERLFRFSAANSMLYIADTSEAAKQNIRNPADPAAIAKGLKLVMILNEFDGAFLGELALDDSEGK